MTNFLQKAKNYWISDASFVTLLVMLLFTVFILPVMIEREGDTTVFLNIMFILLFFVGISTAVFLSVTGILYPAVVIAKLVSSVSFKNKD